MGIGRDRAIPGEPEGGGRVNAAAAQAIANNWLHSNNNISHTGDPVQDGDVWRFPIHVDFPVPLSTDLLLFKNIGEIVIDSTTGKVVGYPSVKEREGRMVEELSRLLGEIHRGIPAFECERCGACCGVLGATCMEMQLIDTHVREQNIEVHEYLQTKISNTMIVRTTEKLLCPYLKDHTCMVYSVRPTICRLFGTVTDHMICAAGRAATGDLTSKEAFSTLRRVSALDALWLVISRHKAAVK